jgi:hypothetical protein
MQKVRVKVFIFNYGLTEVCVLMYSLQNTPIYSYSSSIGSSSHH